jgi:selenophosphate synthetase-related protein
MMPQMKEDTTEMTIFVKTETGKRCNLKVNPITTGDQLVLVHDVDGTPPNEFRLLWDGT